jgi:putative peptide zinc metalloprotease protein
MTGPAPRRAKIELLVRRDGQDDFELREVPSAAAYLQLRPQRLEGDSWELAPVTSRVDRRVSYVLKNRATDRFIMLTEPERFLWEHMDGHTSIQELATSYVLRFGRFDFDAIPHLIAKLRQVGLITMQPSSRLRQAIERNRRHLALRVLSTVFTGLERINISSRRVHPFFVALYRAGGRSLFTGSAVVACVVLGAVGGWAGVQLWRDAAQVAAPLAAHPIIAIVAVKLLFFLTLAAHQVVHGLALVHYGRRVREFGFTFLHGFVPTFYVDVTDIFMADRRARLVTAVSGTLVHLVCGALWFLLALELPRGLLQGFAAASGLIQLQALVVSLYPFCFIEMDGYHVLVDLLGLPTLRQDAFRFVRDGVWRRLADGRGLNRQEGIWVGYFALSTASIAAFVAFNVYTIAHVIVG